WRDRRHRRRAGRKGGDDRHAGGRSARRLERGLSGPRWLWSGALAGGGQAAELEVGVRSCGGQYRGGCAGPAGGWGGCVTWLPCIAFFLFADLGWGKGQRTNDFVAFSNRRSGRHFCRKR